MDYRGRVGNDINFFPSKNCQRSLRYVDMRYHDAKEYLQLYLLDFFLSKMCEHYFEDFDVPLSSDGGLWRYSMLVNKSFVVKIK